MKNLIRLTIMICLLLFSNSPIFALGYRDILKEVGNEISALENLGKYQVDYEYQRGEIILHGSASSEISRLRIEKAALSVKGVKSVTNQIKIVPDLEQVAVRSAPIPPSDQAILESIKKSLRENEGFDLHGVSVEVKNGQVTISGSQHSFRAVDKILSVVLMVDGVKDINSQLLVNGSAYPLKHKS